MMDFVTMRGAKVEHSGGYVGLLQRSRGVKDTFTARRIILRCALVLDTERRAEMEALVSARDLDIKVMVDQQRKWFFS